MTLDSYSDREAVLVRPVHERRMPVMATMRGFQNTRWSLVLRAAGEPGEASRAALDELCRAYRAPLLDFARYLVGDPERAEDLVHGFFAGQIEKLALGKSNVVSSADPARGRFRAYLRSALRNYAHNVRKADTSASQGGGAPRADIDPGDLPSHTPLADRLFDQAWARALLDRALSRLAEEHARAGKGALFEALRDRLTEDEGPPLREVAARLGTSEGAVKVALHRLRVRYGDVLRAEVAETVARPGDVDAELRHLLSSWTCDDEPA